MLLLQITLGAVEPSCIMCVRYIEGGGGGGEGMFSTSAGNHEYIGGYHNYSGVSSEHQRVTMMQVGDIMIHVGGYHEYIGGCSVH